MGVNFLSDEGDWGLVNWRGGGWDFVESKLEGGAEGDSGAVVEVAGKCYLSELEV